MSKKELETLEQLLYKYGAEKENEDIKLPPHYFKTCELVSREVDRLYNSEKDDTQVMPSGSIDYIEEGE
jgi:hypothetical protein